MSDAAQCEVRDQILALMTKREMTVNAIARKMGRHESAVRAWLYGQRGDAKLSTIKAVAKELGVQIKITNGGDNGNGR